MSGIVGRYSFDKKVNESAAPGNLKYLVLNIFQTQGQIKLLHWQTFSYAEHKAYCKFYDVIDDLFDSLIESIQGKYGRIYLGGKDAVEFIDYTELDVNSFLNSIHAFFKDEIYVLGIDKLKDPEIENIIEEILAEIDKLKYLLTLK
jgi:hypothetical protein